MVNRSNPRKRQALFKPLEINFLNNEEELPTTDMERILREIQKSSEKTVSAIMGLKHSWRKATLNGNLNSILHHPKLRPLRNKLQHPNMKYISIEADLTLKEAQIAKKLRDIAKLKKANDAKHGHKNLSTYNLLNDTSTICVYETWLLSPPLNQAACLTGYQSLWANASKSLSGGRPSGGLEIAAKTFKLQAIKISYDWIFTKATNHNLSILIGNIYLRPSSDIKEHLSRLQNTLDDEIANY
ncbi:hypothetical protein KQX54_010930 [Cotesia glomerata]|uniref:Uncharacterized protein n=1 Tax=Cotesia glomerata TaxID=32391 RepID=A0AAV7HWL6_COTGL|nr:hypothetical protein KQX54_010930 [Cotesia glomerata]